MSLFTLKVHELCNESCIFCFQDHDTRWKKNILKPKEACTIMYLAFKKWYKSINFSWWEPLIHPNIITFIAFAKKIGFEVIWVHTNAIRFSEKDFLLKCIAAWLNNVNISIHHSDIQINDKIVRIDGATNKALLAIELLHWLWIYTVIYIVLNQYNYRNLYSIVADFFSQWIVHIVIMFPTLQWSMLDFSDTAMVSYNEVIPYVNQLLASFDWVKWKYIYLFNIPACLVPKYKENVMTATDGVLYELDGEIIDYYNQKINTNNYISLCTGCEFKEKCSGIDAPYIEKYGSQSFIDSVNSNIVSSNWINQKNLLDYLFQGSIRTENDIVHLLKIITSETMSVNMTIPITWFDNKTIIQQRNGILYDLYQRLWEINDPYSIFTCINQFKGKYRHIEFSISNQSQNSYKYILWFDRDYRYQILHYIFSVSLLSLETIGKLVWIFQIFSSSNNLFHLGIDPESMRLKLYISLYDDTHRVSEEIITKIYKILWIEKSIKKDDNFRKYDCIWIDISKEWLELKIYELLNPDIGITCDTTLMGWNIKEYWYMKSVSSRKKLFYRFNIQKKLDEFSNEFVFEKILSDIWNDSKWLISPLGNVKYSTVEWEKKELYFI